MAKKGAKSLCYSREPIGSALAMPKSRERRAFDARLSIFSVLLVYEGVRKTRSGIRFATFGVPQPLASSQPF
jgi:hypothetical protein